MSAVSVLVLAVLLLGCGMSCLKPVQAKSQHSCCDPKSSCKTKTEMKSDGCERDVASVPQAVAIAVDFAATSIADPKAGVIALTPAASFAHNDPPQRPTPLRI